VTKSNKPWGESGIARMKSTIQFMSETLLYHAKYRAKLCLFFRVVFRPGSCR